MSGDASSSLPPLPAAEAAAAATALAPGFRFHPTDEELVSYYLKRKVLSKPFAVDAIAEVDLYKADPWDLPARSRIQSRDMEWYFFSPLDKKYSNRSRTNRATGTGYWKTTGKDRPIKRGSRIIGMKKTLVFHVGRAPKGNRTNWVMHEYRLEDDDLVRAGVPQDEYVVCRIFEKHGPGPQNGAQYGAPLVEEEWEDDGKMLVPEERGAGHILEIPRDQQTPKFNTAQQEDIQSSAFILVSKDGGHNTKYGSIESSRLNEKLPEDQNTGIGVDCNEQPEMNCDLTSVGEYGSFPEPQQDCGSPNDDFLEMNDLADPLDTDIPVIQDDNFYINGIRNDLASTDLFSNNDTLTEINGVEEFFHTGDGSIESLERVSEPSMEDNFYLENSDLAIASKCIYGEQSVEYMLCCDSSTFTSAVEYDAFVEANDFLEPLIPEDSATDPMDEIIAYLDATESNLGNLDCGNFSGIGETHIINEVYGESQNSPSEVPDRNVLEGSPSSEVPPPYQKEAKDGDYDFNLGKTFKGRLIGMLGSISAPPAFAAEPKDLKLTATSHPSSSGSIHITAGMICINGLAISGNEKLWSAQKDDVSFLLSYSSMTASSIQNDSDNFAPNGKVRGGAISLAVRSGFCLSFLSVMFLAVIFKVGACIYSR